MTISSWQNKLNKFFMCKTLLMKGGAWFYTTKTIGVNVEDDDSYMDTYVSPLSTQITPSIIGEEEADDVHANHNDHDEGELINSV